MMIVEVPWHTGYNIPLPEGCLVAVGVDGRVVLGRVRDGGWSETATSSIIPWGKSVAGYTGFAIGRRP